MKKYMDFRPSQIHLEALEMLWGISGGFQPWIQEDPGEIYVIWIPQKSQSVRRSQAHNSPHRDVSTSTPVFLQELELWATVGEGWCCSKQKIPQQMCISLDGALNPTVSITPDFYLSPIPSIYIQDHSDILIFPNMSPALERCNSRFLILCGCV